jgi:hypothetical protein
MIVDLQPRQIFCIPSKKTHTTCKLKIEWPCTPEHLGICEIVFFQPINFFVLANVDVIVESI